MERLTAAEYQEQTTAPKGGNKYSAQKTVVQGITFDSKREAQRWAQLRLLERAGEISEIKLQVPIMLVGQKGPLLSRTGRQMRLTVDFTYKNNKTGLTVYEDAKGTPTRDYEVRKAVAEAMGYEIIEV